MEQQQLLMTRSRVEEANKKLMALMKKAFDLRQEQLKLFKQISEKYTTLEPAEQPLKINA